MRLCYSLLFAGALLLGAFESRAQTVGSSSNIYGTNYFPVQVSTGTYQTNQVYQAGAFKTVTFGNITSTNEGIFGYYVVNPTNGLLPAPGLPGFYIIGTFTNGFAAGTNGGSWSTTFNGTGQTVPSPVEIGFVITGGAPGVLYTNSCYVP